MVYAAINSSCRIEDSYGNSVRELDFGTLLKGVKKEQNLWVRNTGPREIELKLKIKIGKNVRAESSLQSPHELGIECSSTVIESAQKSVKVSPFSKSKLSLVAFQAVKQK